MKGFIAQCLKTSDISLVFLDNTTQIFSSVTKILDFDDNSILLSYKGKDYCVNLRTVKYVHKHEPKAQKISY